MREVTARIIRHLGAAINPPPAPANDRPLAGRAPEGAGPHGRIVGLEGRLEEGEHVQLQPALAGQAEAVPESPVSHPGEVRAEPDGVERHDGHDILLRGRTACRTSPLSFSRWYLV